MTERVRVAVRVRPRNTREAALDKASLHTLDVDADHGQVFVCKKKNEREVDRELRCAYDRVFGPLASQDDVFAYVQDAVAQVAQGFNCTIFAYGQTGTGKTHTMLGKDLEQPLSLENSTISRRDQWGVIPRAIEKLFEEVHALSAFGAAAIVHCSYMQLYNNDVFDLLQTSKARMKDALSVREMIKGNAKHVYVSGLSEFRVTNVDEAMALLHTGNKHRTIRATEYNERSSRSHALLQLSIEVESRGAEGAATILRRAKLNLVDLAGSEKWDTDVSMGTARCKELTSINQSLSALGNVIAALTNPKRSHIPYRDSKLTRLLQDSLGGNTRTVVLATISEDVTTIDETISTLSFADRAKSVVLRVQANEMVDDAVLLAQAHREIARLKLLLKKQTQGEDVTRLSEQVMRLSQENAALVRENKTLKQKLAAERMRKSSETVNMSDIGLQLMVYTFRYDCWYPCTVVGYDSKRRWHCCQYEYGDKQWQDLSERKLQFVGRLEDA
ncbi:hypothetical protein Poli38472_009810 [Pythium oligandrum]|uniref:Kinesin-like protein n=1 Tax=Pythium oligandrum TaxID=41045 RepID=A0A8K1CFE1_PYTOL|nr:hypothetical protein Poli38472_009810 [Pythium oligandrum]|eukprot:TMW62317.1 hypothetical protein Poli38472_009810 [Pythium oligandrum]